MDLVFFPECRKDEAQTRELTKQIADEVLRPYVFDDDEKDFFRRDAFESFARRGLTSIVVPKEFGGQGASYRCYFAFVEEVARASGAMAVTVSVTNLVQGALGVLGTSDQKQKYLPRMTSGEWIGAFSLSEPGSGSDAASLKLAASKKDKGYELTGTKMWCSTGDEAQVFLLMGRTGEHKTKGITSFLIEKTDEGFRSGKKEKKLGLRGSPLNELILEKCFIPENRRIGSEGEGLKVALSQLDSGRIGIAAISAGIVREALDKILKFQSVNGLSEGVMQVLAGYYAELQAVKSLITIASDRKDAGQSVTLIAAQAKLLGSDLAMRVTSDVVSFMGQAGAMKEAGVERLMRDAKALQIVEGTNQIQKVLLAREMIERTQA